MALSLDDKYRVVFALCHSGKVLTPDSTHYNSVFASRLENLVVQVEDQVVALLDKVEAAKTVVESGNKKDNVKQVGDIVFDTTRSRSSKVKELNRLLGELSLLLDIPNMCKYSSGGQSCLVL